MVRIPFLAASQMLNAEGQVAMGFEKFVLFSRSPCLKCLSYVVHVIGILDAPGHPA